MKKHILLLSLLALLVLTQGVFAYGSAPMDNSSLLSASAIVQVLPEMWDANLYEVKSLMENYPDFSCEVFETMYTCQSINNRFAADVDLTFYFEAEYSDEAYEYDPYTPLTSAVVSLETKDPTDLQRTLSQFWLDGMSPVTIGAGSPLDYDYSLIFSTENTILKYYMPTYLSDSDLFVILNYGVVRG